MLRCCTRVLVHTHDAWVTPTVVWYRWLMDVCGTLSNAACNAEACDPVLSGNSTAREDDRTLVRREDDGVTPQATCWTKDLQEWMSENGRGSFVNTPDDNVTAVLQEFLSERVDLRGDLLFSSSNTTDGSGTPQNSKVLAALWHFSSTFVEPQSQRKTEGVMNAWASTVSDLARTAPGRPVGGMYSTGRYAHGRLYSIVPPHTASVTLESSLIKLIHV